MSSHSVQCCHNIFSSQLSERSPSNEALHNLIITTRHPCAPTHTKTRRCNARKHLNLAQDRLLSHQTAPRSTLARQGGVSLHMAPFRDLRQAEALAAAQRIPLVACRRERSAGNTHRMLRRLVLPTFLGISVNHISSTTFLNHKLEPQQLLCSFSKLPGGWHSRLYHKVYKTRTPPSKDTMSIAGRTVIFP